MVCGSWKDWKRIDSKIREKVKKIKKKPLWLNRFLRFSQRGFFFVTTNKDEYNLNDRTIFTVFFLTRLVADDELLQG